ncbi:hypothetical protein [Nitrososphaera viennensis]|uniref:CopG family transcriptional regulator n=2 Tax=Nitrososphaera viennensis TaxID=1034015 RepID=A0A060HFW5_9ARCH|nr:hypothetical protein [Nitrososphaera viennensis]AIC14468.1 hypothetical protein NVIE_002820 [Nitrososphaera viennensis EN76]UVS69448.1 hypothetical protein NWT39_01350 [Nitrososphaera viennensis]
MTTISVRVSEKEKAALRRHGKISKVVKEAINLYLDSARSRETFKRLKELQQAENITTTTREEAALIREDRHR